MNNLEIKRKSDGIFKDIKCLKEQIQERLERLKEIEQICSHDIAVCLDSKVEISGWDAECSYKVKCLYCGAEEFSPINTGIRTIIDISSYGKRKNLSDEKKFEIIQRLYEKIISDTPNISEKDIAIRLQKMF